MSLRRKMSTLCPAQAAREGGGSSYFHQDHGAMCRSPQHPIAQSTKSSEKMQQVKSINASLKNHRGSHRTKGPGDQQE